MTHRNGCCLNHEHDDRRKGETTGDAEWTNGCGNDKTEGGVGEEADRETAQQPCRLVASAVGVGKGRQHGGDDRQRSDQAARDVGRAWWRSAVRSPQPPSCSRRERASPSAGAAAVSGGLTRARQQRQRRGQRPGTDQQPGASGPTEIGRITTIAIANAPYAARTAPASRTISPPRRTQGRRPPPQPSQASHRLPPGSRTAPVLEREHQ